MKKILFRADGNQKIGAGHIMRCLSIAEASKELGYQCHFFVSDTSFFGIIVERGFECTVLHTKYDLMEEELVTLLPLMIQYEPDYIIIDSYFVTASYLEQMRHYGVTLYVDDLAAFAYPVDVLLNYNIFAKDMEYTDLYQRTNMVLPKFLLGSYFTPLRKEFHDLNFKVPSRKVSHIFVSAGGADPERVAIKLIKYLQSHKELVEEYHYHFVIGTFEPDVEEIKSIAEKESWLYLHQNVSNMSSLMCQCDMAISAAGSTLYELCACGIPTITYILADNQILGEKAFVKEGIMLSAGDCRYNLDFEKSLCTLVKTLGNDYELRYRLAVKSYEAVSKNGAHNIIKEIVLPYN